jgi:hypothetical protein
MHGVMEQHNGYGERREISNMVWVLVQIVDIAWLLSEARVWECTGSDKIEKFDLKLSQLTEGM